MKRYEVIKTAALLVALITQGHCAQLVINTGASANDHTGDSLRTAFQKVNTNFASLLFPYYYQTNTITVLGSSAQQSLLGQGVGSTNLAAFTNENRAIRITAAGSLTSQAVASNLTFGVTIGASPFIATFGMTNNLDGAEWRFDGLLYTVHAGTNASLVGTCRWTCGGFNNGPGALISWGGNATPLNSSTNNPINLTAQFNIGAVSNAIECRQTVIEVSSY